MNNPALISTSSFIVKCQHKVVKCSDLSKQIDDAGFSLNHPNQYFVESQKLLVGGKEIKKEAETPQRGQENTAGDDPSVPSSRQHATTQAMDDMGDLDSYFVDE